MITSRNLTWLGLGTVAVLAIAFWLSSLRTPDQLSDQQGLLFPTLTQEADDINRVTLTTAGNTVIATLEKDAERWTVAEKDGYDADAAAVRKLLIGLTDAKIVEPKTAKPELYERLGVEDIAGEDAGGMLVTLEGGSETMAVIIGSTAPRADSTFVRKPESAGSLLVSGNISPSRTPSLWLDKALIDVAAQRVHRVAIRHPDGETLEILKAVRGEPDFVALNVPDGRELQSAAAANSIGGTLGGFRLEDVRAADEIPDKVTTTEFRTFDGLVVTVRSWEEDELAWAVFDVAFDEELARRFLEEAETDAEEAAETADESAEADVDDEKEAANKSETAPEDAAEPADPLAESRDEARRLQARVTGWVFEIPLFKRSNLNKNMDALLKPLPDSAETAE